MATATTMMHSVGPWTWNGDFKQGWYAGLASADGKYIGSYLRCDSSIRNAPTDEETHANAILIAAAPQLLAACKCAWDVLTRMEYHTKNQGAAVAIEKLSAAINAATGAT